MSKSYTTGYDYFTPEAGTEQKMLCRACGESMLIERNTEFYSYSNNSGKTEMRDTFKCSYAGQDWHDQIIALRRFQETSPSKIIADLVEPEIQQIITEKKTTKEFSRWA